MNFLDLPSEYCDPQRSRYRIWPVKVDLTTSWKQGTSLGPEAIVAASHHIEMYDEEFSCTAVEKVGGIITLQDYEQHDDPAENHQKLLESARKLVAREKTLISLGGEHSITYPIVLAHRDIWPKLSVLHIDAHADLRESYNDSPYNHACPMRRLYEEGIHVTAVGIRSVDESEAPLLDGPMRRTFLDYQYHGRYTNYIPDIISSLPGEDVYVSIDLDGLNPAEMPAVGTPIPGGLTWREITQMLKSLAKAKRIIGADVVELMPAENLHYADSLAARLIYKLISYIHGL